MKIFRLPIKPRPRVRNYLFIFTYGRSGSTLLMGLLNSLPHYCIRGENNNVLYRIFAAYSALVSARAAGAKNSEKSTHPWFGLAHTQPERFADGMIGSFIDHVLCPEPHHRVIGFKEIRFSEAESPDFDGYIDFVRARFPGCRIIFNHRTLDTVAASKWWSTMPQARQKLQVMEDRFNQVVSNGDVFHFHYDRIDTGLDHIRELFTFLGEAFDEDSIRAVLAIKHSY